MLFKDGIVPEWEDDRNRSGGRWLLTTVSFLHIYNIFKYF